MTQPAKIKIIADDQFAVLDPPVPSLEPLLTYQRREFKSGGPTGWRESSKEHTLCKFDFRSRLVFNVGLLDRIVEFLHSEGHEVEICDQREQRPTFTKTLFAPENATRQELMCLDAINEHPMGQIEVAKASDALDRCLLIAKAFPEAKILVVVARRRAAQELWNKLRKALGEKVQLLLPGVVKKKNLARCAVGTFQRIDFETAAAADMVLLPFAEEATGNVAAEALARIAGRRVYAFIVAASKRDALQQIRLEAIAGRVVVRIAKVRSTITVAFAPTPAKSAPKDGETVLDRKRNCYWANKERNRQIAAVCKAAAVRDFEALAKLGLERFNFEAICDDRLPRVVALVEVPEHARHLAKLLPGWRVCAEMPNAETALRETAGNGNRIVSAVYATKHNIDAHIVIRATGGDGPYRLKGFPPASEGSQGSPVLLIDFADTFCLEAAMDAKRRARRYQRSGTQLTKTAEKVLMSKPRSPATHQPARPQRSRPVAASAPEAEPARGRRRRP